MMSRARRFGAACFRPRGGRPRFGDSPDRPHAFRGEAASTERRILLLFLLSFAFTALARAADTSTDWQAVTALDSGPPQRPDSPEAAFANVLAYFDRQEKALRDFLAAHPADDHAFEAKLRLSRLLQIRGDFENAERPLVESRRILSEREKSASPAQRVELDFARITARMRQLRQPTSTQREELLAMARKFQTEHTTDRRVAALLAEIARLFSAEPGTMEALLADAEKLATEDALKSRIADDLTRVRLVGQTVPLNVTTIQGRTWTPADVLGKPTLVIFFASFSEPSLIAVSSVQRALTELPKDSVHVLAICLDATREQAAALAKSRVISWPLACDGKGWEGALVRSLGINALPTVWLLDTRGKLRDLNALDDTAARARRLLREP